MSEFNWHPGLALGVPDMDRDHQRIINYMNELAAAHQAGEDYARLNAIFNKLADFTRRHFAAEEKHMADMAYPRLANHQLIHQRLLQEMQQHLDRFHQSRQLDAGLFRFLGFWLKSHICGIDKQYAQAGQQQAG